MSKPVTCVTVGSMTSLASAPTDTSGPTRAERVGLAVLAPIGPLAFLATALFSPLASGGDDLVATAAAIAAARPGATTWLFVGLLGTLTILIGVLVAGAIARRSSHRLGSIATVLTFVGFATGTAIGPFPEGLLLAGAEAGIDPAVTMRLATAMAEITPIAVASAVGWPLTAIGVLLMGAALGRGRAVPMWVAATTAVSLPLTVIGWVSGLTAAQPVGLAMLAIGFAATGIAYARTPGGR